MQTFLVRSASLLLALTVLGASSVPASNYLVDANLKADTVTLRLPNDTRPITYDIFLETDVHKGEIGFTGQVAIALEVVNNTRDIVVHARQLEIKSIVLKVANSNDPKEYTISHIYDNVTEFLTITSTEVLQHGIYQLIIDYTGELRQDNAGFYLSSYTDNNGNNVYLATTQFESTDARHAFPCYDEPAKKAVFKISIKHGFNYSAVSNMPILEGPVNNGDGTATTTFRQTTLMSTYLIAFIVSSFEYSEQIGRVPHRIYSRMGTKGDQGFALNASVVILEAIEEYLGYNYSLPKMDNFAIPDFAAGAMENWGLVTYREEYLLFNNRESTTGTQNSIAQIVAHEFGHQWFGNLISPDWWTFIWLNEGFATIFAYIGADQAYSEWDMWQNFHISEFQRALLADGKIDPRPMTHYVESPKEISGIFDSVVYSKAASFLIMVRNVVQEDVFKKALQYYLNEMEYTSATEDDLFRSFEKAIREKDPFNNPNMDIFKIFKSWTNQGGYPLITVNRDYTKGTFTIKQEPFDGTNDTAATDKRSWWVPFNLATAKQPHYKDTSMFDYLNVGEESKEVAPTVAVEWGKDDWIVLNKRSHGYYRVNYDLENWKLLTSALKSNRFLVHVHNRAQLIDDCFRLVLAKKLKFNTCLDLTVYLKDENEYAPWLSVNAMWSTINLYLSGDTEYDLFQFYVGKIVEKFYVDVGITERDGDEHLLKMLRSVPVNWACEANLGSSCQVISDRFRQYVLTGQTIEPNMRACIFCNGMRKAGLIEFNFLLNELLKSKDQAYRRMLMSNVMGCLQNVTILNVYLKTSIAYSTEINYRAQERSNILSGVVTKGPIQLAATIRFLMENHVEYNKLPTDFGQNNPLLTAVQTIADRVVSETQNQQFEQLLETLKGYSHIQEANDQLKRVVKANLDWIAAYRTELIQWLKKFKDNDGEIEGSGEGGNGGGGAATIVASSAAILTVTVISFRTLL